ncbi:DnaJ domain-containing protein [Chryseolinea lacunae]|uniref:DnaJ domain-containing protein n=1 Tax=Chryseolinea lacunae TaxID=2801331 RepID=A0ABS1KKV9_9BACT|nr:DnaJ domain-containing protein [Chryseolinea lacunae]MBL0740096.1 DnaJ domain-containing protein [Chryseolinea lacunae]
MDHYQTLGVSYSASALDIKRAYRKIAVAYHPDKNPDPRAESYFKEVTAAYNVLSDPVKKMMYDRKRENYYGVVLHTPAPPKPRHRDPAYRGQAHTHVPPQKRKPTVHDAMRKYLPWAVKISKVCFVIAVCLAVDFVLPNRQHEATIQYAYRVESRAARYRGDDSWAIVTDEGKTVHLPIDLQDFFRKGERVAFRSSLLFNIPRRVQSGGYVHRIGRSLLGNFLFVPLALLVLSAAGVYLRNRVEAGFNLGVTSAIVLVLMIFIILTL